MAVEEKLYSDEKLGVTTYKCPNCGADAVFEPNKQQMYCPYCGGYFDIKNETVVEERNLSELLKEGTVWKEAEVYQCKTCGAKEILEHQEVSMKCPFCGTNNIIKTDELPGLKPQGITPFKIDNVKTSEIAVTWAKKKFYAPKSFKKSVKAEKITGLYLPVFTFDASTYTQYNGRLGKHYTSTYVRNGRTYTTTETRYFYVNGSQNVNFDDYLIQASASIPTEMVAKIEPFSTNDALEYRTEYLRGYYANTYSKSGDECWKECKSGMSRAIERKILSRYSYDVVSYLNMDTKISNEKYKYVLVPVYVGHYSYNKKLYNFYVNGENGKIAGKTPVSGWKVFFTVLLGLILVGGIVFLSIFFDLF